MQSYSIRFIPAFTHLGVEYADTYNLSLTCSRGLKWDGGEFPTREEAVAEGIRRTAKTAARLGWADEVTEFVPGAFA